MRRAVILVAGMLSIAFVAPIAGADGSADRRPAGDPDWTADIEFAVPPGGTYVVTLDHVTKTLDVAVAGGTGPAATVCLGASSFSWMPTLGNPCNTYAVHTWGITTSALVCATGSFCVLDALNFGVGGGFVFIFCAPSPGAGAGSWGGNGVLTTSCGAGVFGDPSSFSLWDALCLGAACAHTNAVTL